VEPDRGVTCAEGEPSVEGNFERCAGSMGFRGTLGRISVVGCEWEPRGEVRDDERGGDEVAMWREEASGACVEETGG
jgi:hypothetical protein